MTMHAVLTGDLVGSSRLSPKSLQGARQTFEAASDDIARWSPKLVASTPDFFRGDSWQLLLTRPGFSLRAAFYIRARLKAGDPDWDTRIAIGLGAVAKIDKSRTSLSSGEAFLLSGHALDAMGAATNLVVAETPQGRSLAALDVIARICSSMADDWSQKQAQAVCLALAPDAPTQAEMAERLGVTQQAVSKALASAKISAFLQAAQYCEALNWRRVRFI
ncbi:MAG: hypothetical protein DCF29_24380 [Alphaproteobacteria bacterium]|nr:MAG: hypothetical protein DCF29_24380 [Alphaproteobacteria bacterium]